MRERGSSTAHPTEKGGGGLPIRSRFGRFRADSVGFGASFRADSVGFVASFRADSVDFVAICRLPLGVSCRFGRFRRVDSVDFGAPIRSRRFGRFRRADSVVSCRFRRADSVVSCRFRRAVSTSFSISARRHQRQDTKKPDSSIGGSGSTIAMRRALLICV